MAILHDFVDIATGKADKTTVDGIRVTILAEHSCSLFMLKNNILHKASIALSMALNCHGIVLVGMEKEGTSRVVTGFKDVY